MRTPEFGGGWQAIRYTWRMARRVGFMPLWRAMQSRNACKTCALGMGGQKGGMRNERGHWPEVCKKSLQAMVADMQDGISEAFFQKYSVQQLRQLSPRELEHLGRIAFPLLLEKGATHFRRLTWDEALGRIGARLKATAPQRTFFYFSGRSSNEAGFLLQLMARVFGTNHVNNCSFYCHQASGVGLGDSIGTGTATVQLDDLEHCDLVFLIGANPASNHPRLMTKLMELRRRGGKVIVINPVRERGLVNFRVPSDPRSMLFGSKIADLYVQPHIGGDMALLFGVARCLLMKGAADLSFIEKHTEGFAEFQRQIAECDWNDLETMSGVSRAEMQQIAQMYQQAQGAIFAWTMGITHHVHGVANVQTIVNMALLRGMVGRPGAGLLPIRGHSNVQGMGTMGVTPELKQALWERLTALGVQMPTHAGYDTMACMDAAQRGEMDFAWCLGGNLYGSNPDPMYAQSALQKIRTVLYLSTTLNTGHVWGTGEETMILPVLARDEERQATTQESMFSFVRISDGGQNRLTDLKSEVEIVARVAAEVLGDKGQLRWREFADHRQIRRLIADVVPGFESFREIDQTKREFAIPGRVIHSPKFSTASGRGRFVAHPLPQAAAPSAHALRLMTCRSEGQFNTVVYEEEDLYRGQERRDVILLNPGDMQHLGLVTNDRVTVRSTTGSMGPILARPFDIRQGNAMMYYPEANTLVPRLLDPLAKTPAFKAVEITVEAFRD